MHQRECLKSNIFRINIIAAVALILLGLILQTSCDFRQKPISKSKTDHLFQSVRSTMDTIKTISEQNMGNGEFAETLETDFSLSLSAEKTVIVDGSDKTEILTMLYSDITDIILNSGLSNINGIDGYKQISGTIPAPKKEF